MTDRAPTCPICGGKVEDGRSACCYGCHLDGLIPNLAQYQQREEYHADLVWTHASGGPIFNATQRPPTGVPILDDHSPPRLCETVKLAKRKPRF
ncbi:MAG TPA: hypothetical protein VMY35_01765 [Phycisphaerae bacterium]|nr:hypothetical protein [Phycisphaerae bacterium]